MAFIGVAFKVAVCLSVLAGLMTTTGLGKYYWVRELTGFMWVSAGLLYLLFLLHFVF